jgi:hypothetical protein
MNKLNKNGIAFVEAAENLYGIGANNYMFPVADTKPELTTLSTKQFYKTPDVYIPILPPFLKYQRP